MFISIMDARTWTAYPFLYTWLSMKSKRHRLREFGKSPKIWHEHPYEGQKILLFALYQKGVIRPDTRRLLETIKAKGHYALVINTLKLDAPEEMADLCGSYIERFNFGRDFGSYKLGFQHVYKQGWDAKCDRVLMLNDSVYMSSNGRDAFIDDMMSSEYEALGSTENYEIVHHLGSFCISFSGELLRRKRFRKFWDEYKRSDVRPTVIYGGEQQLSKALRKAVSSPAALSVLYGTPAFLQRLQEDEAFLNVAIRHARISDLTGWKRFQPRHILELIRSRYLVEAVPARDLAVELQTSETALTEQMFISSFEDILAAVRANLRDGEAVSRETVRNVVVGRMTEVFMSGSQVHQNGATLLRLGLPFIKLDALYRGMFVIEDMRLVLEQLDPEEAKELSGLLLERPYGGDTLRGWRYAAFIRGLI